MEPLQLLSGLGVTGPLGLLLGYIVYTLWGKVGRLEQQLTEERLHCDGRIDALHAEQKEMLVDINKTLRGLLGKDEDPNAE